MEKYEFIGKTLFFPEKGILVVGDLHLGYEHSLIQSGILIPEKQTDEIINELREIFEKIILKNETINKIIFLGDIKHSFSYQIEEKNNFDEILNFLREYFSEEDIILIKGNHDTIDYSFGDKLKSYYIDEKIAFLHGHEMWEEAFDNNIKTIIMGHIHPSVTFTDEQTSKKEKYKCFLLGKYKKKDIIILPSFLPTPEGTSVNNYNFEYEDYFSIIPKKYLMDFEVFAIGEDKVYDFGKIKNLLR